MAAGAPDRRSAKPNGSTPQPGPPNVGHQPPYGYGIPQYMNSYSLPPMPPAQLYSQHHHMPPYPHYGYQQPIYQHPVHPPQGYPPMQYMSHMPAPHPHYASPALAGPYQHSPSPWSPAPNMPPADQGMSTPPVYATPPYAPPPHMHHGQTLYQSSQTFGPRNAPPSPSGYLYSPHTTPQIHSPSQTYARIPEQLQPESLGSSSPPGGAVNPIAPHPPPAILVDQQVESTIIVDNLAAEQPVPAVELVSTTISSPPSQPPPQPPPFNEETKTQVEEAQEDGALRFAKGRIPTPNADSMITFAAPSSIPSTSSPPPNESYPKTSARSEPNEAPGETTVPHPQTFTSAPVFTDPAKDGASAGDSSVVLLSPTTSNFLAKDIPEARYSITSRRPEVNAAPALSFSRRAKIPAFVVATAVPLPLPPKPVRSTPAAAPAAPQTPAKLVGSDASALQKSVEQPKGTKASESATLSQGPDGAKAPARVSEAPLVTQPEVSSSTPSVPVPSDQPATEAVASQPAPPVKQPPKSWAHLLRPASPAKSAKPSQSQSQSQKPALGTTPAGSKQTPDTELKVNGHASVNGGYEPLPTDVPLHIVLSEGAKPYSAHSQATQPRGLINSGNMCFANVVMQALVYSAPFVRLFETLAHLVPGSLSGKTSLYEATILFLREFPPETESAASAVATAPKDKSRSGTSTPMPPEQTRQQAWNENPFFPELLYAAMKQNKRFDSMQRGHQEDAEEFLGFFLDTLHEELLSILSRVQTEPSPIGTAWANGSTGKTSTVDNPREVQRPVSPDNKEGDWMEVGKKNKPAITRTTRATESAITRIFGGKLRSVLSIPGTSKDSVTLEPYQPLQLDIQSDHIRTIEDALKHITIPEIVSMYSETRGGMVDAKKQVTLESLPPLLILHLKRLVYDAKGIQKNSKVIEYSNALEIRPEIISPTRRTKQSIKYQLYGVVYHHGKHATGGHYTIDVLRQDHSEWVRIDDTHIEPVTEKDVTAHEKHAKADKTAYLLFYRREPDNSK
ncbi:ubiquitin carboxyl-terminal hydrolase 10 [Rhizoctonia solani AG-1 IB]|uniref:ubiquitinyl hydrolase 1 n=1 Tax=Thanatephorus cucumeris (strain AG1-IB / isolate 7/3/14) TaxID=1108050 RepID=A0A0B7FDE1_THACB|nr:ubiquitin carboxyl-terminal hydrolase 10 [Rhizoctonia solani AG-1 IB]